MHIVGVIRLEEKLKPAYVVSKAVAPGERRH